MNYEERYKKAQSLHALARQYRGRFLNSMACIEHDLGNLLADYFCPETPERRARLYEHLMPIWTFDRKIKFLKLLVREDYPILWEEDKDIWNIFSRIQRFRNQLAHSRINVSDEALERPIEDGVGFTDWEEGRPISEVEFNDYEVDTNMAMSYLSNLKILLPFKQRKPITPDVVP